MKLSYLYAKLVRRFLVGKSIKDSVIHSTSYVYSGANILDSTMDKHSYCSYDCWMQHVDVGAYCSIADSVYIGGREHPTDWVSTSPVFENVGHSGVSKRFARLEVPRPRRTVIGNDVWIGHAAVIKAGVHVGDGAVIGAASVVTKDVPPYAIVAGNPARVVRYRFDEHIIAELLRTHWWSQDESVIEAVAQYANDTPRFIEELKKRI